HHEVGKTVFGRATVNEPGDVGMLQASQNLPLVFEALEDELGIEAASHQLQSNQFLVLVVGSNRPVDFAHAAVAEPFNDPVMGNHPSDETRGYAWPQRFLLARQGLCRLIERRSLDESVGLLLMSQKRLNLAKQGFISRAGRLQERGTLVLAPLQCLVAQVHDTVPAIRWHGRAVRRSFPAAATVLPDASRALPFLPRLSALRPSPAHSGRQRSAIP